MDIDRFKALFIYQFMCLWAYKLFPILVIVNYVPVNMYMHVSQNIVSFFYVYDIFVSGIYLWCIIITCNLENLYIHVALLENWYIYIYSWSFEFPFLLPHSCPHLSPDLFPKFKNFISFLRIICCFSFWIIYTWDSHMRVYIENLTSCVSLILLNIMVPTYSHYPKKYSNLFFSVTEWHTFKNFSLFIYWWAWWLLHRLDTVNYAAIIMDMHVSL